MNAETSSNSASLLWTASSAGSNTNTNNSNSNMSMDDCFFQDFDTQRNGSVQDCMDEPQPNAVTSRPSWSARPLATNEQPQTASLPSLSLSQPFYSSAFQPALQTLQQQQQPAVGGSSSLFDSGIATLMRAHPEVFEPTPLAPHRPIHSTLESASHPPTNGDLSQTTQARLDSIASSALMDANSVPTRSAAAAAAAAPTTNAVQEWSLPHASSTSSSANTNSVSTGLSSINYNTGSSTQLNFEDWNGIFNTGNQDIGTQQQCDIPAALCDHSLASIPDESMDQPDVSDRMKSDDLALASLDGSTDKPEAESSYKPIPMHSGATVAAASDTDDPHSERLSQSCKWHLRYKELLDFRRKFGHCIVPLQSEDNPPLSHWVKRQRFQYKLKLQGKRSTVTDERQRALEDIGFVWDAHEASWQLRLIQFHSFVVENGHGNVPSEYAPDPSLAIWAKLQRRQYKLFRAGKKSTLTEKRIQDLSSMGFGWDLVAANRERKRQAKRS